MTITSSPDADNIPPHYLATFQRIRSGDLRKDGKRLAAKAELSAIAAQLAPATANAMNCDALLGWSDFEAFYVSVDSALALLQEPQLPAESAYRSAFRKLLPPDDGSALPLYRQPRPALAEAVAASDLIPGILPTDRTSFLFAHHALNTDIAVQLAAAVACGDPDWLPGGPQLVVPADGCVAVYATWCADPCAIWDAARGTSWSAQQDESGAANTQLHVVDFTALQPLWSGAAITDLGQTLLRHCEAAQARLLVLDRLEVAYAGDTAARVQLQRCVAHLDRWARQTGCAIALLSSISDEHLTLRQRNEALGGAAWRWLRPRHPCWYMGRGEPPRELTLTTGGHSKSGRWYLSRPGDIWAGRAPTDHAPRLRPAPHGGSAP